MTAPRSRPEGRSRFGPQSASELGAPVASSIPEQLPGHEPASARKGYEDGNALFRRYRCVEGSAGRRSLARGGMLFGAVSRSPKRFIPDGNISAVVTPSKPIHQRPCATFEPVCLPVRLMNKQQGRSGGAITILDSMNRRRAWALKVERPARVTRKKANHDR